MPGSPYILVVLLLISCVSHGFQSPSGLRKESKLFSSIEITIPQRHPNKLSPLHQNAYPSPLHTIHIAPLLTPEQAFECLRISKQYAENSQCWSSKDTDRHLSYSTADFPVEECDALQSYLNEIDFESKTFDVIGKMFAIDDTDLFFMDLFCAHYEGKQDGKESVMDHLDPHRDGSVISFTIVLSCPEDYDGGGTEFESLKYLEKEYDRYSNVLKNGVIKVTTAGEGVIHSGKIFHGAHLITNGERTTLTGFVEVDDRCIRKGVMGEASREFGRMDNAKRRMERQSKVVGLGNSDDEIACGGWMTTSPKHLKPKGDLSSKRTNVEGFIPAFSTVNRRGSETFQRRNNLETEDILLRDILLPKADRQHPSESFDLSQFGDITIL